MTYHSLGVCLIASALLVGCGGSDRPEPASSAAQEAVAEASAADAFMARIAQHCDQAFAGRVVANEPPPANDGFADRALIMHVRECNARELKVPFHVGDDRSRTWVLTRTATGIRLKHDHRHEDGTSDTVTMYGGETTAPGTEIRQEFPVDAESIALFASRNNTGSQTNTWAMEIEPGRRFLYELRRPSGRVFQVEFDLATPVDAPPVPWGHQ
jgi:hypothetical protein